MKIHDDDAKQQLLSVLEDYRLRRDYLYEKSQTTTKSQAELLYSIGDSFVSEMKRPTIDEERDVSMFSIDLLFVNPWPRLKK